MEEAPENGKEQAAFCTCQRENNGGSFPWDWPFYHAERKFQMLRRLSLFSNPGT
jgi:hypothetical protein